MHCLPALRHLHDRADGPVVEQIKCRVQLQHLSTISRAHRLERLTVELVPNSPVGGLDAVDNLNTPPAIAWRSLIRSDIIAGLLHQDLTPLAHSRHPLALRRPHLHRGVCVCVCVCNKILVVFYATPLYLRSRIPPSFCTRLYASYTPTLISPLLYSETASPLSRFPNAVPSHRSRSIPLYLATPGR